MPVVVQPRGLVLRAGKNIRWVADQLGHADPSFTLRTYAHVMREEETDLSFAEFGVTGRRYASPAAQEENVEGANPSELLARREGFEPPTLRFEA